MNRDIVEGHWKQLKGKFKSLFGKATSDHMDVIAGQRVEVAGKIQATYGTAKADADEQLRAFKEENKGWRTV